MDPSPSSSLEAWNSAAALAATYLAGSADRRIAPAPPDLARLQALHSAFPAHPTPVQDIIQDLHAIAGPATINNAAGRYFGFVNGRALPAALAASCFVNAWDQNAALNVMSPAGAFFDELAVAWVVEALGLPNESAGAIVTGATSANFTAVCAARHALLARAKWDVEAQGLFGAPPLRVVVGAEVHVSLLKALMLAGFGRERVERVPVDAQGRMLAGALPPLDANTIVCIQAGNVNTGAFDPAAEICARARQAGAWVHVDGAFGLWAAASPRYAPLTHGLAKADSWATDAHKWPNAGYDCGIAIVRHGAALRAAMGTSAAYLPHSGQREPAHHGPEMSRRARGVELWAVLRSLGRSGLAELIDRTCAHAHRFAEGLRQAGFSILNDVVINQVLVSFGEPERTRAVIQRIQDEGVCWCGGTEWQGRTAMRISVSSWATTTADVDRSLDSIRRAAASL